MALEYLNKIYETSECYTLCWRSFDALPSGTKQISKRNKINCFRYSQTQGSCQDFSKQELDHVIFLTKLLIFIYPVCFWYYFYIYECQKSKIHWKKTWILPINDTKYLTILHSNHLYYILLYIQLVGVTLLLFCINLKL